MEIRKLLQNLLMYCAVGTLEIQLHIGMYIHKYKIECKHDINSEKAGITINVNINPESLCVF